MGSLGNSINRELSNFGNSVNSGLNSLGGGLSSGLQGIGNFMTGEDKTRAALAAQGHGVNQANQFLGQQFDVQNQLLSPYHEVGTSTISAMSNPEMLNRTFGMSDFQQDPGYQFRLNQGLENINSQMAGKGLLNSGAALKALQRYGQDYASSEYQNAYNRFNADQDRRWGRMSDLAGLGYNASQGMVGNSMNYGNTVSGNFTGLGNANAAAQIAQANRNSQLVGQGIQGGAAVVGAMFSDERLKKDIKPISKADLNQLRRSIKPYLFRYKSEDHGAGEWAGVMAQDLQKSKLGRLVVFEDENGNLALDQKKLTSLLLAALAEV